MEDFVTAHPSSGNDGIVDESQAHQISDGEYYEAVPRSNVGDNAEAEKATTRSSARSPGTLTLTLQEVTKLKNVLRNSKGTQTQTETRSIACGGDGKMGDIIDGELGVSAPGEEPHETLGSMYSMIRQCII